MEELIRQQRDYFHTGATLPIEARMDALRRLRAAIVRHETAIEAALKRDLNKAPYETLMCETALLIEEIDFHLRHLRGWMKPQRVPASKGQLPSRARRIPQPKGVVLIMSPWNYPVQLCLMPLIGALSAGCCAVVKPSAYAPETARTVAVLLRESFDACHVAVVEGGRAENQALLAQHFDHIFFTGSPEVGRVVMEAAAKTLTPVTLELGGKSPAIVDETADLRRAAQRIAFGKLLNAGQTCVAPDYVLVHESCRDGLLVALRRAIAQYAPPQRRDALPVIVSQRHYEQKKRLLEGQRAVIGGGWDDARRFIEPTVLVDVSPDAPVMQEEIFAPILPVLTYRTLDEAIAFVRSRPRPLALYLFTKSARNRTRVLDGCSFGGGCINDTIVHLAGSHMPFGGVGTSGMGSYHGKASFDTFTHTRSVLESGAISLPLRCHPYTEAKYRLVRRLYGFDRRR